MYLYKVKFSQKTRITNSSLFQIFEDDNQLLYSLFDFIKSVYII